MAEHCRLFSELLKELSLVFDYSSQKTAAHQMSQIVATVFSNNKIIRFFRENLDWKYSDEKNGIDGREKRLLFHGEQYIISDAEGVSSEQRCCHANVTEPN